MYTQKQKKAAIERYVKNGCNATKTAWELGYPSVPTLIEWYRKWKKEDRPKKKNEIKKTRRRYSEEEIQKAVDYYLENGCNVKRTVRELGYGSHTGLLRWLRKRVPDKVSKYGEIRTPRRFSEKTRENAVLDLISGEYTPQEVCEKYDIGNPLLYEWKINYIGRGKTQLAIKKDDHNKIEDYKAEIQELKAQKEQIEKELEEAKKELYQAQLIKDVYETAAEVLKKGMDIDLIKTLKNREKAIVINVLRRKYLLKELLEILHMAKSSYCYQQQQMAKVDRLQEIREKIKDLFQKVKERYGYRRIHKKLKDEGYQISEKIVRKIMKEEKLHVRNIKRKRYNSYLGEISPAVENKIQRDFHAEKPNEKWLTDITEFHIEAGKVYLSPIIDCFDGMPVVWTIGESPNAELVNTMLDQGIALLKDGEKPIIHSDRGSHYRWPGWIKRMKESGLTRSMSKKGYSPDNAACEGFFGILKNEMFYDRDWTDVSIEEFISEVNEYIIWFREERIKMSLGGISPMEYRRSLGLA